MRTYCGSLQEYIAEQVRKHAKHIACEYLGQPTQNLPPITENTEPAFPACGECDSCLAGGNAIECPESGNIAESPLEIRIRYKPYNSIYGVVFTDGKLEGAVIWQYDEEKWNQAMKK